MKAVIVVQAFGFGGIQRLIVDEANELHRRGIETHLIYFEKGTRDFLLKELRVPPENVHFVPYRRMRDVGSFVQLVRLLRSISPELLTTHHWFANTIGRLAGFFARIPHSLAFEHSEYDAVKPRRQFTFDRLLQRVSDRVIAISPAVRDSLVRHGISAKRITIVPNGIDFSRFQPQVAAPQETRFLFVGRLIKDKGVDVLLAALAQIKDAQLTVVGDGPERTALQASARELGIEERVVFAGAIQDLAPHFAQATAVVLPSRREGFGLVLVEALASGVPVIASRIGGITDVVQDGKNGVLVPPDNIEALATALTKMTDHDYRASLASSARESIKNFSIQAHTDTLLATVGYHS